MRCIQNFEPRDACLTNLTLAIVKNDIGSGSRQFHPGTVVLRTHVFLPSHSQQG